MGNMTGVVYEAGRAYPSVALDVTLGFYESCIVQALVLSFGFFVHIYSCFSWSSLASILLTLHLNSFFFLI